MRILIFHGYLLHGTGSNVYNAELGAALVRAGHELHLLCQDRSPLELDWVDAAGSWDSGALVVEERRSPVRATVYRPDIGGVLPLYVADRYEGFDARPFNELSEDEVERYLAATWPPCARWWQRARHRGRAGQPPRDGPGDPRPRRPAVVRGQDPRQRAGVHRQAVSALQALRRRGPRGRPRRARRLAPHRREPVGGDGRPLAAAADASRPAGRRRGPFRAARRRKPRSRAWRR